MNLLAVEIVMYIIAMIAIGSVGLHLKGLDDFHLAGRGIKLVFLSGTFCASIVGASATLGMAGLGFSKGLPGAWWMLSGTAGLLVLATFLAERVRSTGCSTLPEIVGSFYGQRARITASILIIASWIGVIAVQIAASGKVLGAVFGGNEAVFMVACTVAFVLYTAHGGQRSVIRTDLVQFIIIFAGMAVLFSKALEVVGPGILISQSFPVSEEMSGWDVTSMLLVVGSAYLVGPDMYSRLLSANSARDAKISAGIAAVVLIPLSFLITCLGIFARSLYPAANPEQAFPVLITGILTPVGGGLVTAALLAAFMSSADTCLMTATSIMTLDIYKNVYPKTREDRLIAISRFFVLIIGFIALILAVSMPGIIQTLLIAYTIFTSGLLFPVIAGFFKDSLGLTPLGAFSALIGGGLSAILLGQKYPLIGFAVSLAFLFGVSWIERILQRME
jgi:SSS family solute:Na+ symporter